MRNAGAMFRMSPAARPRAVERTGVRHADWLDMVLICYARIGPNAGKIAPGAAAQDKAAEGSETR